MVSPISTNAADIIQKIKPVAPPDLSSSNAMQKSDPGRPAQAAPPVKGLGENIDLSA